MATVALSGIITPTNVVTATSTTTLTNKTLTGAVVNGTVGATTPSTGAFTTLSVTSTAPTATIEPSSGTANSIVDLKNPSQSWQLQNQYVGGASVGMFRIYDATNSTNRLTIDPSSGKVGIGVSTFTSGGGILELSQGITFPATQSASSNANTLDDYEEGTFTPTVTAASGSNGGGTFSGSYTKVGRYVFTTMRALSVSKGTLSGEISFGGLPFSISVSGSTATCRWDLGGGTPPSGTTILAPQGDSGTALEIQVFGGSGYLANLAASHLGATFNFYNITYSYITA